MVKNKKKDEQVAESVKDEAEVVEQPDVEAETQVDAAPVEEAPELDVEEGEETVEADVEEAVEEDETAEPELEEETASEPSSFKPKSVKAAEKHPSKAKETNPVAEATRGEGIDPYASGPAIANPEPNNGLEVQHGHEKDQ